ncbi:MAG: carbon-nitrogen hydrolase family protein [Chloroflexi bacterium]|nr:carbon-nitrogen hydrolase family protein [Chloroflexota bacterium]
MKELRVAAVQLNSRDDKASNVDRALALVERAASLGAELVALPEYFNFLGLQEDYASNAEEIPGPTSERLSAKAKELEVFLLGGSILEKSPETSKYFNTSLLFDPAERLIAKYRKIHLYDVELAGKITYQESASIAPGVEIVLADIGEMKAGLSICYDLRFPELYRALSVRGAKLAFVPTAFSVHTGKAHWEILLRARAIENQFFVVAPAQFGASPGYVSYGRAMIVDPWGTVLVKAPQAETVILADLDFSSLERLRQELPSLTNRRLL